jgi:hypothetical protein
MIVAIKSTGQCNNLSFAMNDEKTNSQMPEPTAQLINIKLGCS